MKKKFDKDKFLSSLIQPTDGAKNSVEIHDGKVPHGIIDRIAYQTIQDSYNINNDAIDAYEQFVEKFLVLMSMEMTHGVSDFIFGKNFTDMFNHYANLLNLASRMKKTLDDNGIEFDINNDNNDEDKGN